MTTQRDIAVYACERTRTHTRAHAQDKPTHPLASECSEFLDSNRWCCRLSADARRAVAHAYVISGALSSANFLEPTSEHFVVHVQQKKLALLEHKNRIIPIHFAQWPGHPVPNAG